MVKNCLIFIALAFFHLLLINALNSGISIFDLENVQFLLVQRPYVGVLGVLAWISIFFVTRWSKLVFFLYLATIFIESQLIFVANLSKFVLLFNFIFMVCAYYFWVAWTVERKDVIYNPGYGRFDIDKVPSVPYSLNLIDRDGQKYQGLLHNWDRRGCYIYWDKSFSNKIKSSIERIEMVLKGYPICVDVALFTSSRDGAGFKIARPQEGASNDWDLFYSYTRDRKHIQV